jgi:hypothetical protein
MVFGFLSIVCAALFLAVLGLLHFLKPDYDPTWRMISEYEIGRFGWMMRVAFFGWAASLLALLLALWPELRSLSGSISRGWFLLIVCALVGAGIFKTDPITQQTSSPTNVIHTLCGTVVILTFPIAATLAVHSLLQDPAWAAHAAWLVAATVLIWAGMLVYFASVIRARLKDPTAGSRGGPKVLMGWPNRFNVLTYLIWIMIVAATALQL